MSRYLKGAVAHLEERGSKVSNGLEFGGKVKMNKAQM